ncbi:MAG: tRNA (adenosine(37)-N6)-threonylcarbamoyltransferase complex ATPase subunit type 1 TsaE [Candidatus Magasanikbacteria bacterium CG10_big_fil_rev_8_21_14_0_10_40_10]|uniref:tRNA threonylcarbamoyladenosine biosynthesis protein TsaE n=1 Tax=Candidatus Magasanikbacteria bacterium CG10_big_fil_rev_8_21_14_0_10_40_10 TaxID=1974648 RepID=A0A2M6W2Z2_9BACT|nr:MAG: tRNA (adenosine(37)-N6)-threonylcarbamoyltransferase complex ATPase subunit type 1 TsaE [Candidatus Magasanikbacteria bacterium CG10_big_fil_rev_8_21_14_0_10_40_10]
MISHSKEQTIKIGQQFAKKLKGGDVVLLQGELGTGKTSFVQGVAIGLGIKQHLTSPTFSLMNLYNIKFQAGGASQLAHIDTYRLKDAKELLEIGAQDYLGDKKTICLVEWPQKAKKILAGKTVLTVKISHLDQDKRKIEFL